MRHFHLKIATIMQWARRAFLRFVKFHAKYMGKLANSNRRARTHLSLSATPQRRSEFFASKRLCEATLIVVRSFAHIYSDVQSIFTFVSTSFIQERRSHLRSSSRHTTSQTHTTPQRPREQLHHTQFSFASRSTKINLTLSVRNTKKKSHKTIYFLRWQRFLRQLLQNIVNYGYYIVFK